MKEPEGYRPSSDTELRAPELERRQTVTIEDKNTPETPRVNGGEADPNLVAQELRVFVNELENENAPEESTKPVEPELPPTANNETPPQPPER